MSKLMYTSLPPFTFAWQVPSAEHCPLTLAPEMVKFVKHPSAPWKVGQERNGSLGTFTSNSRVEVLANGARR
jgi:hypothetical protein